MKELRDMTPDEAFAEAARRAERRRNGLPIHDTPEEVQARLKEDDDRLEKEIQRDIVKLYRAYGCRVYNLSQARATKQSPGLADLWVIHRGHQCAWWHETKTPSGEQSPAQIIFAEECAKAQIVYIVGGVATAEKRLVAIGAAVRVGDSIEPSRWLHA